MTDQPMSQDRQNAIRLMMSRGWAHKRDDRRHVFTRPDTGGFFDCCRVIHGNLSLNWAIDHCGDEELADRISALKSAWVAEALAVGAKK